MRGQAEVSMADRSRKQSGEHPTSTASCRSLRREGQEHPACIFVASFVGSFVARARDKASVPATGRFTFFAATMLGILLALPPSGHAQDVETAPPKETPAVSAPELDEAIRHVIQSPEYSWRLPRESTASPESQTWAAFWEDVDAKLRDALDSLVRLLRRFRDWLDRLFPERNPSPTTTGNWGTPVQAFLFVAMAAAASILAVLLYRLWKRRREARPLVLATAVAPAATLTEEATADERPSDQWMALARQFMDGGEWRLAIRAMFLAGLAHLAQSGRLTLARHKSNRDYLAELERRAHDRPAALTAFAHNTQLVERVWYGRHSATATTAKSFADNQAIIMEERPT